MCPLPRGYWLWRVVWPFEKSQREKERRNCMCVCVCVTYGTSNCRNNVISTRLLTASDRLGLNFNCFYRLATRISGLPGKICYEYLSRHLLPHIVYKHPNWILHWNGHLCNLSPPRVDNRLLKHPAKVYNWTITTEGGRGGGGPE